jgi:hypothetical protein
MKTKNRNSLKRIQDSGPTGDSQTELNLWYERILNAANALYTRSDRGIHIRGSLEDSVMAPKEEQAMDWDPITKTWGRAGYQEDDM